VQKCIFQQSCSKKFKFFKLAVKAKIYKVLDLKDCLKIAKKKFKVRGKSLRRRSFQLLVFSFQRKSNNWKLKTENCFSGANKAKLFFNHKYFSKKNLITL